MSKFERADAKLNSLLAIVLVYSNSVGNIMYLIQFLLDFNCLCLKS